MSPSLSPRLHDTEPRSSVTGANRGIGYDLVLALLKRYPNAVLFAGARDPTSADALNELANSDSRVHVVELIADDEESNKGAVEEVKKVTDRLDIVVANAGALASSLPTCFRVLITAIKASTPPSYPYTRNPSKPTNQTSK